VDPGFWRGKKVLLTGHTGFKGAWFSLWLRHLGADVAGYALDPPTRPSLFELARVGQVVRSLRGDVRDLDRLAQVVRELRPDVLIHMAAQALVRASYRDPVETFSTNVLGTVNVLEAVRRASGVRVVVNVTSDKCYENRERAAGYREDEAMGGHDPYSSSKGCAELVTAAYRRSFFSETSVPPMEVALATARAGNVIGGGDWGADRFIPDCVRALTEGRPIPIRNPDAVRPWQFVLEPLGGYLLLAERLWESGDEYAGAWNFGPDEANAKTVRWAADRIVQLWAGGASWVHDRTEHPHEAQSLRLDCSKARSRLGWSPRTDVETAIQWVVEWHKRVLAGEEARAVTVQAIERFMDLERHASG